jgi:integrase
MFGCKITPKGRRIYILQYRVDGRLRRYSIAKHGSLTPDQARTEAKRLLGLVASGTDPASELRAAKGIPTVKELADRYLDEHARPKKKKHSIEADERMIRKDIVPFLGSRKVSSITQQDIGKIHHHYRDTPVKANRLLSLLSKMFNLSEAWGLRPGGSNPCKHITKYREAKKERLITQDELARLGDVLRRAEQDNSEFPSTITAIRLLIFTGCRKSEILNLQWNHIDFNMGLLLLPDSKTGAKAIPLSAPALELLQTTPELIGNPYVCPGRKDGTHMVGLQKAWERIRKKAKINDIRLHDLRHCFTSVGAASGLSLPIIGGLLGHRKSSTTERYAHLSANPLKQAADKIAGELDAALKAPVKDKVVNLDDRRGK